MSEATPTAEQLARHERNHGDHDYVAEEYRGRVRCSTCRGLLQSQWNRRSLERDQPTERQRRNHARLHADHAPHWLLWGEVAGGWRCAVCAWQRSRRASGQDDDAALWKPKARSARGPEPIAYTDSPTVVRANSPLGVTVGQLMDELQWHHPDDRIEVLVDRRRREGGHRVTRVVVLPSVAREGGAA